MKGKKLKWEDFEGENFIFKTIRGGCLISCKLCEKSEKFFGKEYAERAFKDFNKHLRLMHGIDYNKQFSEMNNLFEKISVEKEAVG